MDNQTKTPNFNKKLNEILENLKPHQKTCEQCNNNFEIFQEDIEFYKMLQVPPPKLCPECRKQNRLAFSNYTTFYKRKCDAPNHSEKIISQIPENTCFPVYDCDYYWSDNWDSINYGKDYNFSELFFEQFKKLLEKVPQPATTRDPKSVNSDYSSYGIELKDCYYIFGGMKAENISYGNWPVETRDSIDVLVASNSEFCYEVVNIKNCYNCKFAYFSSYCLDSAFIYDCHNCQNCFGCVNLRNKKYHFFNEPLTKEKYEEKMKNIDLGNREILFKYQEKFFKLIEILPKRNVFNKITVNSTGTLLENCKNCFHCFLTRNGENIRFSNFAINTKDSMDLLGINTINCYNSIVIMGNHIYFSVNTRDQSLEVEYLMNCRNCSYCFGCIGLNKKEFCILNKQYSKEKYYELLDKIKIQMLKDKEYGEFFPSSFSPFPYNGSMAQISFPLTEEKAKEKGLNWVEPPFPEFTGKILKYSEVPKNIKDVSDEILDCIILCEKTGKPFRIIKSELEFYRKKNLPIPIICPAERLRQRFSWIGFLNFEETFCSKCKTKILVNYRGNFKENILCEKCYLSEVA
ncbi:MAG: hypothetical protein ABH808_04025 [Candidatus Kuenenbacteria bacterium]